jgi:hypothetical protein
MSTLNGISYGAEIAAPAISDAVSEWEPVLPAALFAERLPKPLDASHGDNHERSRANHEHNPIERRHWRAGAHPAHDRPQEGDAQQHQDAFYPFRA